MTHLKPTIRSTVESKEAAISTAEELAQTGFTQVTVRTRKEDGAIYAELPIWLPDLETATAFAFAFDAKLKEIGRDAFAPPSLQTLPSEVIERRLHDLTTTELPDGSATPWTELEKSGIFAAEAKTLQAELDRREAEKKGEAS